MGIKIFTILCSKIVFIKTYEAPFAFRNSTGTEVPAFTLGQTGSSIKRRSLSDSSLTWTETIEIPIIHEPPVEPVEPTTDVQAKVPKLEMCSPVLGLTVPLHSVGWEERVHSPIQYLNGQGRTKI